MNIITKGNREFDYELTYYLAGPMTGLPEYNYPAFGAAVKTLSEEGILVLSPHHVDEVQHEFHEQLPGDSLCGLNVPVLGGHQYVNVIDLGARCGLPKDDPIHSRQPGSMPYHFYLKAGFKLLLECDGIILLHGWTQSKGVKHELYIARSLGYPVYTLGEGFLMELGDGEH